MDDPWRRRRDREDKREAEESKVSSAVTGNPSDNGKLLELLAQADSLIEQVNNLYNQYISGAEKLVPVERRSLLDNLMAKIMVTEKSTASLRFKFSTIQAKYVTHRDRWDKLMRDLEAGQVKQGR